ncbi:MAG: hypothetical protein HND51_10935 [Chloroflexi bacterium]|nr:hypothetical protein [Chloroflexota bacterium]
MENTSEMQPFMEIVAHEGLNNAAKGFGSMVGTPFKVSASEVSTVPVEEIPFLAGGPENEIVGIYLHAEGDVAGQILLMFPVEKALELVDLLMEQPEGTTQELDTMARSALAEVGNLVGSFFLNSVASLTGLDTRPSPPAIVVDMVAALLSMVTATCATMGDEALMIKGDFSQIDRGTQLQFWVMPDPDTLGKINEKLN